MDNYGLLLWLHHLLLYIMDNLYIYISRVSGISSVRRLAAAVPSAPRRRARQSSAAPRGAAAPPGTVRLGASWDGKVGRFRGRFSGEKWWKHHKTPGNSWEKYGKIVFLIGWSWIMWISPAKLVDCHKHGRIKQGKTGDSVEKAGPLDHQFPCKFSPQ